jgi:putative hydrolase of the HAD superfamily
VVLGKLELGDIFTHIFDIRQCNFMGKPRREVFDHALKTLGVRVDEVLFIDDYPVYIKGFIAMGGKALLLDEKDIHADSGLTRIRELKEIVRYI